MVEEVPQESCFDFVFANGERSSIKNEKCFSEKCDYPLCTAIPRDKVRKVILIHCKEEMLLRSIEFQDINGKSLLKTRRLWEPNDSIKTEFTLKEN